MTKKVIETRWKPLTVCEVAELFQNFSHPWWLAGGHALDTFLNEKTRHHSDIDIIVLRKDQLELQEYLRNWQLYVADGELTNWTAGSFLEKPTQDIWAKKKEHNQFWFQVMLLDTKGKRWAFKRDSQIGGEIGSFGMFIDKVPTIKPEIQLLYKFYKTDYRKKDLSDLDNILLRLNIKQFKWLEDRLHHELAHDFVLSDRFQLYHKTHGLV